MYKGFEIYLIVAIIIAQFYFFWITLRKINLLKTCIWSSINP